MQANALNAGDIVSATKLTIVSGAESSMLVMVCYAGSRQ
jgi:hypothetical protein